MKLNQNFKKIPDVSGNTSRCLICESIFYWARDCLQRSETDDELPKVQLLSEEIHDCYTEQFVRESLNSFIHDCYIEQFVGVTSFFNS